MKDSPASRPTCCAARPLVSTWLLGVAAIVALLGCVPTARSGDDTPGDGEGDAGTGATAAALRIDPEAALLYVDAPTPAEQAFTVVAIGDDGGETDVTASAEFAVADAWLASMNGNVLVTAPDRGGTTTVTARWGGRSASALVDVVLRQTVVEPSAPADAPDRFGAAQPGGVAPELVYPGDGVIVPPNLGMMEFHYRPGAGNQLFELTVTGARIQLSIYFACTVLEAGCRWEPSQPVWDALASAGRSDAPLVYHLRGLSGGASPRVGQSPDRTIQFAFDDMLGGIYYWAATPGAVMRYEFGRRGQTAERFLGVGQTGATVCVGCHALSRDGSRIAVGLDIPGPAAVETYDVASRSRLWRSASSPIPIPGASGGGNFFTFSPDNQWLLSSDGRSVVKRSADGGAGTTTVIARGSMPDWSADGLSVVFARPETVPLIGGNPGVTKASLHVVDTATWGNERLLVAQSGTTNNYYPSFSPDNAWVVFNRAAGDSFDAQDARLWLVAAAGGAPVQLARATGPTGGDSWPKWAPFVHTYRGGRLLWLTFSSRRPIGLRPGGTSQVWMVGLDPARAEAGLDPTFVAFWLPFQDAASGNHIAQWVEEVRRRPCGPDAPCSGGDVCDGGVCVPPVIE